MTEKERVLAMSMDETKGGRMAFHNDLDWSLQRHEDDEFVLEGYGGSVSCAYSEKDAPDSSVWPLAAQILGIREKERPTNDLLDMLKAIVQHADQAAMDDALFRKFARANALYAIDQFEKGSSND